jgi:hypothetical protein
MLRFQFEFQLISPTDTKIKFHTGFLAVWFFRTHTVFSFEMIAVTIDKPEKIKIMCEH